MATAVVAVAQKIHVEVAGFQAFGEFHGSNVDCSANAELMARHPLDGSPLDAATLNAWWADYTRTGHGDAHGATLAGIYWHLTSAQSAHRLDASRCRVARYIPTDSMSQANLHTALIAATAAGQTVIVFLGNAQALAYNERGVRGHFVALGGIDSDQGYLVGNGDDVNALGGHGIIPTRWYGWASLAAAQVNGMIALARVAPTSDPAPTAGVPSGWRDDGATLTASNGVAVRQGFRDWVLAHSWDAANTPRAGEYASAGGTRQDFRYCSLVWTAAANVGLAAIGDELAAAKGQVAQLNQQLASVEKAAAQVAAIRAVLA